MATQDYYAVLGVASSATADEIKKSYRRLAKQYHPDANRNDPRAADRFKTISEAYTVLGNAEKRKQYDEMRRLGAFDFSNARNTAQRPRGGAGAEAGQGPYRFDEFDVGGLGGLGDLFGSIFTGRGRGRGPEAGPSVETTLEVPFRVAATGGKLPLNVEVTESCATCNGSGAAPGAKVQQCVE